MFLQKRNLTHFRFGRLVLYFLFAAARIDSRAQLIQLESAGARYGFSINEPSARFIQSDVFALWNIPSLRKDWKTGWWFQTKVELNAGWLRANGEDAAVFGIGPNFALGRGRFPVSIEGGFRPTFLTRYRFDDWNFGVPVQFTSHAGLNVDLGKHWRIGYRFQHMSNAQLAENNPGLNLHMFGISYLF